MCNADVGYHRDGFVTIRAKIIRRDMNAGHPKMNHSRIAE